MTSLASAINTDLKRVIPISCIFSPSITKGIERPIDPKLINIATNSSWLTTYLEYPIQGTLSLNKEEELQKITTKCKNYTIIQGILYRENYGGS